MRAPIADERVKVAAVKKTAPVEVLNVLEYVQPSVDARQIRELATSATSRWVANGDSVLLLGPPGWAAVQ